MFTILVVGRNDNYGINLHKRTALSLNYLASLCQDPDDEIIYVDCNTPAYEWTLAEAIADTLTPQARQCLRVFRVTGEQMYGTIGETPLKFSDELSRNVGIRRSNPKNSWILSTNCDMLVQPLGGSFHDMLKKLKPAFYLCPRVSIPIPQWMMLDRTNVRQISDFCDTVIQQGFRLPEEKPEPWLRFESVGDFQLAPREQWFAIGGCEEGMKLTSHSDANNARRLNWLNGGGRTPDLAKELRIFHLNHNIDEARSHYFTLPRNDWKSWVEDVKDHHSRNPANWGLADVQLPEIRVSQSTERTPEQILAANPRQRNFVRQLKVKMSATFWAGASKIANRLKSKHHSEDR